MPERTRNLLLMAVMGVMAATLAVLVMTGPDRADRVADLGSRIRCPVCEGQPIADSPTQMAQDMMALVEERVAQGATDQAIIDELLASYSGALLIDPPLSGSTLALWIAPAAALLIGIGVIVWWRSHPLPAGPVSDPRSRRRLVGGLVLAGALGASVVIAGFFIQDRETGPLLGVANPSDEDISQISNQTMEAVVAANPEILGMRLALAERYFEEGDYRAAFPHYLAVAESELATGEELVAALVRLGWMAWDGNRETETALGLFDQALSIDGSSPTALYLKAQVLWCGMDDVEQAAGLLSQVLTSDRLPQGAHQEVQADLEAVQRGERCQ